VPYVPLADGRGYALFPRAFRDPLPLDKNGKLYTKEVNGVTQLFFLTDAGDVYQITPTSATASPHIIIWRPATPSGGDFVQTWDEVASRIDAVEGNIIVYLQGNCVIPSTADQECYGRVVFSLYTFDLAGSTQLTVQDGGRLRNPFTFRTAGIHGVATVRPFISLTQPGAICIFREGGSCTLDFGSTVSAIEVAANFQEVACFEGATLNNQTGNPAVTTVRVLPGFTCLHAVIALAGTNGPPAYPDNTFSGDATTVLIQIYDASAAQVSQPNFAGFVLGLPMDWSNGVVYQDGLTTPTLGAGFVQAAIDVLKRRNTGSGPTASRPAIPADIATGGSYFDTDLGYPVYSNGAIYVDALGAPA